MSVDLECGCSVGRFTGVPHSLCKRHLAIERKRNLNPIMPEQWPLDGELGRLA